jgi:GTP diphosphokinase / guanosine-3',5'-bis(diphosphate) 3'-diphosphatase
MAALLHDVIEDTPSPRASRSPSASARRSRRWSMASASSTRSVRSRAEAQAESFRKMLLAMVEDIRVILVKLADRLHNMRTLGAMPADKQRRIARETLDIYAPIANRLGMNAIKLELEDLGFRALHPFRYRVLERALRAPTGNQKTASCARSEAARRALSGRHRRRVVTGREKHLYSIYKKMRASAAAGEKSSTSTACASSSPDIDTCYRVLGLVHRSTSRCRALQGLHRDPARQRLPVAAHHAVRPQRRAARGADPHRGHGPGRRVAASPRTGSTRRSTSEALRDRRRARASGCPA